MSDIIFRPTRCNVLYIWQQVLILHLAFAQKNMTKCGVFINVPLYLL